MIDRLRPAHIVVTLRGGEGRPHVPAHLDVLAGAARPVGHLDGGPLDRMLRSAGGAFRAAAVYHARGSLGRVGTRALGFDDLEEELGLARTYRLQLSSADATARAVDSLRSHRLVESATAEPFATAPASATTTRRVPSRAAVEGPYRFVRAFEGLAAEPGDERVTVAVVDTGVSLGHSEFQRKLLSGYDSVELGLGRIGPTTTLIGDSHGSDFSPSDDVGHGSHVAGIIGAQGWQVPAGVGGKSLMLPIRVLAAAHGPDDRTVTGVGAMGDIDAGLKVAVDLGADVLNMSFGTPESAVDPDAPAPHTSVIEYAARRGCVMIAASGNSGGRERFFPAASEHVVAVGSVGDDRRRSEFSTYGDHVALAAPGEDVVGVGRRGYRTSTGTSHAAPFVTGAAALLVARARRRGQAIDAATVRRILTRSAQPSSSPADEVGAGVLDVAGAIAALDREYEHPPPNQQEGARHGHREP